MRRGWWVLAMLLGTQGAWASGCASSVRMAVAAMLGSRDVAGDVAGYRVVAVRMDGLRGRSWAMVGSCADAARPLVAIELEGAARLPEQVRVRLGERVLVVSEGSDSRMQFVGWAESGGGVGDLIRVRMRPVSTEDAATPVVIRCCVVGKGLVEVVR